MVTYLLHSGGLDSHMAWLLHPAWTPVYVMHGAPAEDREIAALGRLTALDTRFWPQVIDGPPLDAHRDGHMPYRNALLLATVAHHYPDAEQIAYGSLLGEGTGDKSAAFRRALTRTLRTSESDGPRVVAPLHRWTKAQALRKTMNLPRAHALHHTVSCYDPIRDCGKCQACFRRGVAEYLVGWQTRMPAKPELTEGIWHSVRNVPLSHLPSMALSNIDPLRGWVKERTGR